MNFYPHHIGDFNNSTRHLTRVERSVYRDAIELYYDKEQMLTTDLDMLCKKLICRSDEEIEALKSVLNEFFELTDEGYFHHRCNEEIHKYQANTSAKAKAGRASAEARKKRSAERKQNSTRVNNQEPLTNNHKPITNNHINNGRFAPPKLQDVVDYMVERGEAPFPARSNGERFIDYYESKGWVVGKSKMKDWKAAVRNWMKNNFGGKSSTLKDRSLIDDLTDTSWAK